jgi:uncharacterized protein with NAD-binding domain and iron-sulfur cluster
MKQERKKIAVIGAGIAGCTCAQKLAKHHDVEIFEAAWFWHRKIKNLPSEVIWVFYFGSGEPMGLMCNSEGRWKKQSK